MTQTVKLNLESLRTFTSTLVELLLFLTLLNNVNDTNDVCK